MGGDEVESDGDSAEVDEDAGGFRFNVGKKWQVRTGSQV